MKPGAGRVNSGRKKARRVRPGWENGKGYRSSSLQASLYSSSVINFLCSMSARYLRAAVMGDAGNSGCMFDPFERMEPAARCGRFTNYV